MGIIPKWMKFAMGGGYDSISSAYFARMTTQPSAEFKKVIDTYFVKNKKTVNGNVITAKQILAKLKFFYLGNINDSNDSFVNICSNSHHGTKEGSGLVWDSFWGYGNPNGTGYIDTHFNPNTEGGALFTQNSAGFGCYLHSNFTAANTFVMGVKATNYIAFKTNSESFAVNQAVLLARANVPFRAGLHGFFRTASNAINAKNQNLYNTTGTNTSTAIPSGNIRLFDCNGESAPYTGGINIAFGGGVLTDDEFTALNLIVNEYLKQCLYLKYGADNWGVKMAKSYFDTLHNFEPYEAWEIYEFIKRHQPDYVDSAGTGYLYNTFGPGGQNKTVADYIMLFKAGGNLVANAWSKTGATLRWNQDGTITTNNTMPAYTRGSNLGIVTVTSTDGWNGVTNMPLRQTRNSVNSFYGNLPLLYKLKNTTYSQLQAYENRIKSNFMNGEYYITYSFSLYSIGFPGYHVVDLNTIKDAGTLTIYSNDGTSKTQVYGNISTINQNNIRTLNIQGGSGLRFDGVIGTLQNYDLTNYTSISLVLTYCALTGGTYNWNKVISSYTVIENKFPTVAVDAQLSVINTYFTTTTPIKNVTIDLSGTNMSIPTGGANNTDLLGIVAKHTAAGFTATCIVRTS